MGECSNESVLVNIWAYSYRKERLMKVYFVWFAKLVVGQLAGKDGARKMSKYFKRWQRFK